MATHTLGQRLSVKLAMIIAVKLAALTLLYQYLVKPQLVHVDAQQVSAHMVETHP